jgi:ubiquinone biosynthesis protein
MDRSQFRRGLADIVADYAALPLKDWSLADATEHMTRSGNRLALALVTLGPYIAASLLMLHSVGPRIWGEMPAFAALAYALALWFTLRLARSISRSGGL